MEAFTRLDAKAAPLPLANIDTDQIIPKQFLKTVEREGLGKGLFFDFERTSGKPVKLTVFRASNGRRATSAKKDSETTAIHAVGSGKRRTMAGAEASRIAPSATPVIIPAVR